MPNETLDKRSLYMRQVHEELHNQLRTQKYVNMLLGSDREKAVDHFYGVHIISARTARSDKYFDVDTNDFMIVDGVKYKEIPGLY